MTAPLVFILGIQLRACEIYRYFVLGPARLRLSVRGDLFIRTYIPDSGRKKETVYTIAYFIPT